MEYFKEEPDVEVEYRIKVFGIEFAPVFLPIERRLQTFAVGLWFVYLWISIPVNFVKLLMMFFSIYLIPVAILYIGWLYWDRKVPFICGRKMPLLRKLRFWKYFRDYFPIRLIKTVNLPKTDNYLFCVYPHGRSSSGAIINFGTEANHFQKLYPGLEAYILTSSYVFYVPFMRDSILSLGWCPVAEKSIFNLLGKQLTGRVAVVAPGGISEAFIASPGKYQFYTKYQRELIRVSMKLGISLVPVISFGENDVYNLVSGKYMEMFQRTVEKLTGYIPILPQGRGFFQYTFGILPHRKPINTVVGAAIKLPKIKNPSEEDVNTYYQMFIHSLEDLFNKNKSQYDETLGDEAKLEIFESY